MSTPPQVQKADFSSLPTQNIGKVSKQTATLDKLTALRITVHPGGGWSKDLKAAHGTDSCQHAHVGYMLSGTMAVKMDDGEEMHASAGSVFTVRPGHDAWCVGDEPAVFVEFSSGNDAFAK
jgi:uncharacterized protein YaiE (UPF0345 family)